MDKIYHLSEFIPKSKYWGRGIIAGLTPDGTQAIVAYFIMGRSENSRNRVFVRKSDGIKIEFFDPSAVEDASLIMYSPIRIFGKTMIVTNGDQTDTVYDFLSTGRNFEDALDTRTFEPDAPNFTPRISALLDFSTGSFNYKFNIIRAADAEGTSDIHQTFDFTPHEGVSHFIHTYKDDGDPLPSFDGEPEMLHTYNSIDLFTENLWKYLDDDNKVSLFVRYIDIHSLDLQTRILNKNKKKG